LHAALAAAIARFDHVGQSRRLPVDLQLDQITHFRIAQIVGVGCDARMVGYAMASTPEGGDVPWQRIVNREGKISVPGKGGEIQRMRLEAEGITFDARGRIDMKRFGWQGPGSQEDVPPEVEQPSLF